MKIGKAEMVVFDLFQIATAFHASDRCLSCGDRRMGHSFLCAYCCEELWMRDIYEGRGFNNLIRAVDAERIKLGVQSNDLRVAFMVGGDLYSEIMDGRKQEKENV